MLELKNITKDYVTGDLTTHALNGVSISFRKNEFASILGPSGCGKTTLLNIIGGLDRYTNGELLIKGKSTKEYKDRDWDTYRNHSIGFVFQSYNLIMHQNICRNVELALTIGGISRKERHERAVAALTKVGLGDVTTKMPNQLSGGQMQRVAIARALVNDPEILLADEPTGALDSETSVQIMDLLKEIASDRLVIMVTHNPELAKEYSTRIIRLSDGIVVDDSNPVTQEELDKENETFVEVLDKKSNKKASMSFGTALALSFKNLLSKKGRTILTGIAGSIGIVGIALILSMSDGFNTYIANVESDTLSEYPLSIYESDTSTNAYMSLLAPSTDGLEQFPEGGYVTESSIIGKMGDLMSQTTHNNLSAFKTYLDSDEFKDEYGDNVNAIQYSYDLSIQAYTVKEAEVDGTTKQVSERVYPANLQTSDPTTNAYLNMITGFFNCYTELINNENVLNNQYDVLKGKMPTNKNEVVVMVDKYNRIDDVTLFTLGLKDPSQVEDILMKRDTPWEGTLDDLLGLEYYIPVKGNYYAKNEVTGYFDSTMIDDDIRTNMLLNTAEKIKIVGVIRPKENATATFMSRGIGYRSDLTTALIEQNNNTEAVQFVKNNPTISLLDGSEIDANMYQTEVNFFEICDVDNPSAIYIYPKSFSDKDAVVTMISNYNARQTDEKNIINYTDTISLLMSSVTKIVNSVTYVLIAFVSISLVVSSIMIGIITYVSVIERTKEIGVLRSLGASKSDVANVFNAETLIIGFIAGLIGVLFTLLLIIPINLILHSLVGISHLAFLRWYWCALLIAISMFLTFIAGVIPSQMAAKKDPVIALRSGD